MSSLGMRCLLATAVFSITFVCTSGWPPQRSCQPLSYSLCYNFPKIARQRWYETWTAPATRYHCVVRDYSSSQYAMNWTDRLSPTGTVLSRMKFQFSRKMDPDFDIQATNGPYFQQFLDTDNVNWILLATCFERRKYSEPAQNPMAVIMQPPASRSPIVAARLRGRYQEGQLKVQILQTNPYIILPLHIKLRIVSLLTRNGFHEQFEPTLCLVTASGEKPRFFDFVGQVGQLPQKPSKAILETVNLEDPEANVAAPEAQLDYPDAQLDGVDAEVSTPAAEGDASDTEVATPAAEGDVLDFQLDGDDAEVATSKPELYAPDPVDIPPAEGDASDTGVDTSEAVLNSLDAEAATPEAEVDVPEGEARAYEAEFEAHEASAPENESASFEDENL